MTLVEAAKKYLDRGFSVIPVRPDKTPFVRWEIYQRQKPTQIEIHNWWNRWPRSGIGIVTGSISGIVVIDVDDPDKGMQTIGEYLTSCKVPTVKTPRGGYHLYFKAPEKCPSNSTGRPPGIDFRGEGGYIIAPPSQNGTGKGYEWLVSLDEAEPPPLPASYISFLNSFFSIKGGGDEVKNEVTDFKRLHLTSSDFTEGGRDETIFHIANCLVKGGMQEEDVQYLIEIIANKCCDPPFPINEAKEKIRSALKRADRREKSIAEEVRDFIVTSSGAFLTSECFNRLHLTSREEKKAVVLALLRFKKDGLVERYGEKNGCYRRIETECEEIDFLNAPDTTINISWPFRLEKYINTLPKNIIVVAGEPDAGKTAFLLNAVKQNMNRFSINYFSSEMGSIELRSRLSKFGIPLKDWKVRFKERSSNFADVIKPDEINIIDFLEITGEEGSEFYKVGGFIKHIYDKLNKGIAIIGLQKNRGVDFGLGGMRGLEKARLYLSMGQGQIKITKAKNWFNSMVNPNGLKLDFKLAQGCEFLIEKDWYK